MNTKTNFYVFQYAGKEPALNRSDELEAYLAQYFYASSREYSAWVIDKKIYRAYYGACIIY